ncbi:MAG: YicC family protein [Saprospiraceae bacterium]|nr:YicC family protein [Saprospiraceae bacterium]
MTAYGRGSASSGILRVEVEVRSVNSKFLDLRLKYPNAYREREMDLRQMLAAGIERGKADVTIQLSGSDHAVEAPAIDAVLFRRYAREILALAGELGLAPGDTVMQILRIPQVVTLADVQLSEEEWQLTVEALEEALYQFNRFRSDEGQALARDLSTRLDNILALIEEVTPLENDRIHRTRHRIRQNLAEFLENEQVDENRFEQEILFYLEKMDITEEKVRLAQHCRYFLDEMAADGKDKGRKLNFITQEIGREINTLGAKAYDSGIQQIVVLMKNELEKVKEQLANIL